MRQRIWTSLAFGALVALALGWYSIHDRHARLATAVAAARVHQSTGAYLTHALIGVGAIVAVVAFILATIAAKSRSRSRRSASSRRGGRGAGYSPGAGWSEW
jgi:heme/copper-type cytochrome/quinol oxidase subunit 2